jgi:hypothetical protein
MRILTHFPRDRTGYRGEGSFTDIEEQKNNPEPGHSR